MIEKNSSKTEFGFDYKNQEIPVKRHSSKMLHSKVNKILLLEEKKITKKITKVSMKRGKETKLQL